MSTTVTVKSTLQKLLQLNSAEVRLLDAIRCPASYAGLVKALELVLSALEALYKEDALPRVQKWQQIAQTLLHKCETLGPTQPELGSLPVDQKIPVFSALANPPKCDHFVTSQVSHEILGKLILSAVSRNTTINAKSMEAWATLRRNAKDNFAKRKEFSRIGLSAPRTRTAIESELQATSNPGIRTLLEELLVAIETPIADTTTEVIEKKEPATQPLSTFEDYQDERSSKSADAQEDPERQGTKGNSEEEKSRKISPTGWLVRSANFAQPTQRFGLIGDRERLHPETLKLVCNKLLASFVEGDEVVRDRVALAHLSLKSGLPARLALQLPIRPVSYPNINVKDGTLAWNYRLALDSDESNGDDQLPPRSNQEIIHIGLDAQIAEHLRLRLQQTPNAESLCDILQVPTDDASRSWITGYRKFLRDHGDKAHPAYDARFARSCGDVYRNVCGSEILAAFLAQDFPSIAMGVLSYVTLPTQRKRPTLSLIHI